LLNVKLVVHHVTGRLYKITVDVLNVNLDKFLGS